MLLFVDNDVAIKLAEYELLLCLQEIIANSGHDIQTLESLPYVAGLFKPTGRKNLPSNAKALEQLKAFIGKTDIASIAYPSTFQLIASINDPHLDEGELTLLGCALESDDPAFCSGDKRAIQAANKLVESKTLPLEHCIIIILEHTLKILLKIHNPEEVISKVLGKPNVDKAIGLCFRGATPDTMENVFAALESYIGDLKRKCDSLTFWTP